MNNGGGNGTGCFEIRVRTDTTKFTNLRKQDLERGEIEVFFKNKTKIASEQSEWC